LPEAGTRGVPVIGLTGGIGSGKSTVADRLVAHGAALVDTDAIAQALTGSGGDAIEPIRAAFGDAIDFDRLLAQGFAPLPVPDAPFADGGFQTPSGRCEFFSERLARLGLDGLPDHLPNYEVAGSSARYPLAMISPPARHFLNSTFVNVKSLRDIEGEPVLEISAEDAAARGITSGRVVRVFNDRGDYHCQAVVSDRARPGVVNGLGVWWRKLGLRGTNVNELTSQKLTDLGRAPVFYDCLVDVQPL
jgi:anaerobic selenocysteine-containing dehydrogenase